MIHEIDYSDNDILVIELPKNEDYVFQPKGDGSNEEESKEFQDPLANLSINQEDGLSIADLNRLDLEKVFRRNS